MVLHGPDKYYYPSAGSLEKARGRPDRGGSTAPVARFPGDPGPGKLYFGLSLQLAITSIDQFETQNNVRLAMFHRFYNSGTLADASNMQADIATDKIADRLPWVTFKLPGPNLGWVQTYTGGNDAWLTAIAQAAASVAPFPVWISWHNEPQGDGQPASDFVQMHDYAGAFVQAIASNIAISPILNGSSWEFNGDPKIWNPPGADFIGYDHYNQWWTYQRGTSTGSDGSSQGYKAYHDAATVMLPSRDVLTDPFWGGRATGIAEYACHHPWATSAGTGPNQSPSFQAGDPVPGVDVQWQTDAYNFALANNCVCLSWFNSAVLSPRGEWTLDQYHKPPDWTTFNDTARLANWLRLAALPTSIRPSQALT